MRETSRASVRQQLVEDAVSEPQARGPHYICPGTSSSVSSVWPLPRTALTTMDVLDNLQLLGHELAINLECRSATGRCLQAKHARPMVQLFHLLGSSSSSQLKKHVRLCNVVVGKKNRYQEKTTVSTHLGKLRCCSVATPMDIIPSAEALDILFVRCAR